MLCRDCRQEGIGEYPICLGCLNQRKVITHLDLDTCEVKISCLDMTLIYYAQYLPCQDETSLPKTIPIVVRNGHKYCKFYNLEGILDDQQYTRKPSHAERFLINHLYIIDLYTSTQQG